MEKESVHKEGPGYCLSSKTNVRCCSYLDYSVGHFMTLDNKCSSYSLNFSAEVGGVLHGLSSQYWEV